MKILVVKAAAVSEKNSNCPFFSPTPACAAGRKPHMTCLYSPKIPAQRGVDHWAKAKKPLELILSMNWFLWNVLDTVDGLEISFAGF